MLGKEMLLLAAGEKDETGVLEIRAPGGFAYLDGVNAFSDAAGTYFPISATSSAAVEVLTGIFPFCLSQEKPIIYVFNLAAVENCTVSYRSGRWDNFWDIYPDNPKKRSIVKFTYSDEIVVGPS